MGVETRTFPPDPRLLTEARSFVASYFAPDVRDEAALLTSEIATNAIRHVGGWYTITVQECDGFTRVTIGDHGGSLTVPSPREADDWSTNGRGLALVEILSRAWGALTTASGTFVWFEMANVREAVNA